MHAKAFGTHCDGIMLDLEDSVPLEAKKAARQQVIETLLTMPENGKCITFRMNAVDTPFGYKDLREVVEAAGQCIETVVVPKVDHPGDIYFVDRLLFGIETHKRFSKAIGIEVIIESARGMEAISDIVRASPRIVSVVFGIADYAASVGARSVSISGHGEKEEDIYPGHRWHFAMSRIVMAAKAMGLMAIDAPYGNFKDETGLERSASMARAIGFDGKWAIHPGQIDPINRILSPLPEDIALARRILDADAKAGTEGRAAVALDGRMIDQATVRLAKVLWAKAKQLDLV